MNLNLTTLLAITAALSLFATKAAAQGYILWKNEPAPAGLKVREDVSIVLEQGTFKLGFGDKSFTSGASAQIHDNFNRTWLAPDHQTVQMHESSVSILLGFGNAGAQPKDQRGALTETSLDGQKVDGRWVFRLAEGAKPQSGQSTALRQFAAYVEIVEALGRLYGAEPRKVGDVWRPDLSALKRSAVNLDADLECRLVEVTERDGDQLARVSVKGHGGGSPSDTTKVRLDITASILRSLRDMVDLDMQINGTFELAGKFGGEAAALPAEIKAPLKVRRTVKVVK